MNLSFYKKNIDRMLLIVIVLISFLPVHGISEVITLQNGEKVEDNIILMKDGMIELDGSSRPLPRDLVKEIYFSSKEYEVTETAAVDDEEIKEIIAQAEEFEKRFPGYNGLVLLDDGYYEYKEDGTNVYKYHYRFKVLKDVKKREANVTFYFDEGRERISIPLARTISADGKVYNLDPAKIKISTPSSGSRSFSRYNTLSFVLPNVEVGSIIEYITETDNYNPFERKFFFPRFGFYGSDPTSLSRFTVTIPENEKLYYVFRNFDEERKAPEIIKESGRISYIWKYEDLEPLIAESNMPSYMDIAPFISCSLFDDWDTFFNWSKGFIEKKIIVTKEIEDKVAELTKRCTTDEERIAKIYHYVQQEIRYISIKSGIGSGYSGHKAIETLHNEYGDCIDKAILFTTMLKVFGVASYPIILKTNDRNDFERRLPGFDSNHAITKVVLDGKELFLDTTTDNFRYPYFSSGDHGVWVINPLQKKIEYIETPPPEDNASISKNLSSINENGDFEVNSSSSYTGQAESNNRYYSIHIKGTDLIRYMKNYLNSLSPGSKLKYFAHINSEDISRPYYSEMGFILKNFGITAGDLTILSIPNMEKSFGEIALEKRKYPLEFTSSSQENIEYVIDLSGSYKVKYLPEPLHIDSEYFSYDMDYKEVGGKIIFSENYTRKKRVVPLADYDEYRAAHKEIERRSNDKIFLTRLK